MKIRSKKFKRPKNREDSSDFDDFRTKRIVSARPIVWKIFERTKRTKIFRKIQKLFEKNRKVRIEIISTPSNENENKKEWSRGFKCFIFLFMWFAAQGSEIFGKQKIKQPKKREDSSDFDNFRTKRIVSASPISGTKFEIIEKFSKKLSKTNSKKKSKKF